mgnify:CR=1 FL=1
MQIRPDLSQCHVDNRQVGIARVNVSITQIGQLILPFRIQAVQSRECLWDLLGLDMHAGFILEGGILDLAQGIVYYTRKEFMLPLPGARDRVPGAIWFFAGDE